jgi:hypothetical protein
MSDTLKGGNEEENGGIALVKQSDFSSGFYLRHTRRVKKTCRL